MMLPPTNHWAPEATGTPGTRISDRRVAHFWRHWGGLLLTGFALGACGGESEPGADSSSDSSSGGASTATNSGAVNSTSGNSSTATTSPNFGSPGPVTSGATSSVGSGGTTNASTDGSSGGSGGSGGGPGGAGGSAGAACEPQDVAGIGDCDAAFGVFFLGDTCGWVTGCSCVGDDCDNGYADDASCEAAHQECFDTCGAQDVTLVGGCEPASVYMFNGVECVAMDGCSCVGEDCDAVYPSPEDCAAAHAGCADRDRSCDEIEAAYDDYVSHRACQDDSDCVMVFGHCAIGIGGCHYAVNRRWNDAGLEALGDAWTAAGYAGPVCDCAEPPDTVSCDDGVCTFQQ
ncbi:MAG TPA: hypothetical protein VFU02_14715 [Polyangiaceae bacterium]|nr:hypothetical protein [Polyangiaceae bacterium]